MKQHLKRILKMWMPPILVQLFKKQPPPKVNTFEGVYDDFAQVPNATDYNNNASLADLEKQLRIKLNAHAGHACASIANNRSQITNLLPLLISSINEKPIRVLDFGGGAGDTYLDVASLISIENIDYFVHDLPEAIRIAENIFPSSKKQLPNLTFIDDLTCINEIDLIYLGSVLQYITDYRQTLLSLMQMKPKWVFLTDHFMTKHSTYVTAQVNMPERTIPYRILSVPEVSALFSNNSYRLVYESRNYEPLHHFDNFPPKFSIGESYNLLFKKLIND